MTVPAPMPSITCPRCGLSSYHADDIRYGYCGNCHDWTQPYNCGGLGCGFQPCICDQPEPAEKSDYRT
jgi:hypothetical protein